jgi:hypothetical protein
MTSQDYVSVRRLLHSDKTHKLTINFDAFPPYNAQSKIPDLRGKKIFKDVLRLLDKRLNEVKVLYILNPTVQGVQDTSEKIMYDTIMSPIYKLNFKKMISLKTVYLIGDDADDIIKMPMEFYSTPTKTVYFYNLNFPDRLKNNLQQQNKTIEIIFGGNGEEKDKVFRIIGL